MRFHIVRSNEVIRDILDLYNLTKEELMKENKHITSWRQLVPGTKLRIPVITESVEQGIKDMEPFIEDYYPKLKPIDVLNNQKVTVDKITSEEEKAEAESKYNIADIPELSKYEDDDYLGYNYPYQYPQYYPVYAQPNYYNMYYQNQTDEDD